MIGPVHRIAVGVDGSGDGERALHWAIEFGAAFEAEVVAVHAIGLLAHLGPGPMVPSQSHLGELRQVFEATWCAQLDGAPVSSRRLLVDGPPVEVLLRTAQEFDADLIVVGRRGAGGSSDLLLGSTSHQVAERASRPVLIVPPPMSGM